MKIQLVYAQDEFLGCLAKETTFGKVNEDFINRFQYDEKFRESQINSFYKIAKAHNTLYEFITIGFLCLDASRNALDDLFRHRHASVNMQSTRNKSVGFKDTELSDYYSQFYNLKSDWIEDITENPILEKERDKINGLLPIGIKTQGIMFMNLRELITIYGLRSCSRAREEIRIGLAGLKEQIKNTGQEYHELLLPRCEHIGYCPESDKDCCGRHIKKSDAMDQLERLRILKQETL